MSSRPTGISSLRHRYCCFRREPQPLCSMLKEMALDDSVAEKSFTGIETNPKETVSEAMERAAMILYPCFSGANSHSRSGTWRLSFTSFLDLASARTPPASFFLSNRRGRDRHALPDLSKGL